MHYLSKSKMTMAVIVACMLVAIQTAAENSIPITRAQATELVRDTLQTVKKLRQDLDVAMGEGPPSSALYPLARLQKRWNDYSLFPPTVIGPDLDSNSLIYCEALLGDLEALRHSLIYSDSAQVRKLVVLQKTRYESHLHECADIAQELGVK